MQHILRSEWRAQTCSMWRHLICLCRVTAGYVLDREGLLAGKYEFLNVISLFSTTQETHGNGSCHMMKWSKCIVLCVHSVWAEASGRAAGSPGGGAVSEDGAWEADWDHWNWRRGREQEKRAADFLSESECHDSNVWCELSDPHVVVGWASAGVTGSMKQGITRMLFWIKHKASVNMHCKACWLVSNFNPDKTHVLYPWRWNSPITNEFNLSRLPD